MDKPACYRSYTPAARTECARCAWRGPCAVRTAVGPFTFIAHPRYPREVERPDLVPTTVDNAMAEAVFDTAVERGLHRGSASFQRYVCVHRKRIARVDPGVSGTVLLNFPCVPAHRLSEMPAASRASIKRSIAAVSKSRGLTVGQMRENRRLGETGSVALLSSAEDAVNLLVEVARHIYGDHRD